MVSVSAWLSFCRSASCLVVTRRYPNRMEQPVKSWHPCFRVRHVPEFSAQSTPRLDCLNSVQLLRLAQDHFQFVLSVLCRTPNKALHTTPRSRLGLKFSVHRRGVCELWRWTACSRVGDTGNRDPRSGIPEPILCSNCIASHTRTLSPCAETFHAFPLPSQSNKSLQPTPGSQLSRALGFQGLRSSVSRRG